MSNYIILTSAYVWGLMRVYACVRMRVRAGIPQLAPKMI